MKWRDLYASSLENQSPDPSRRPVLAKPRVIPLSDRQETPAGDDPDIDSNDDGEVNGDRDSLREDSDDDIDSDSPAAAVAEQREHSRAGTFHVGDHITSPFLLDILSDTALYSKQSTQPRSSTKRPAASSGTSARLSANEWI